MAAMLRCAVLALLSCAACDTLFGLERTYVADAASDSGDGPADADTSYRGVVLADQPLAYWRFGPDSVAQAVDETGNGHAGTYVGGVARGTGPIRSDGATEHAIVLDGVDDHVAIGNVFPFAGVTPFTLEAWVSQAGGTNTGGILSKTEENAGLDRRGYLMFLHSTYVGVERSVNNAVHQTTTTLMVPKVGVWTHVVATFDGTLLTLYLDGVVVEVTGGPVSVPVNAGSFVIGARASGLQERFKGSIDEVAVYDRVLPPGRIGAHYAAAK